MERIEVPKFESRKDLIEYLIKNERSLIAQKKAITKEGDGLNLSYSIITQKGGVDKANEPVDSSVDVLDVRVIINTTNLMDSHLDVHLPGLWDKSLNENLGIMHIQEHVKKFDHIISDGKELKVFVKNYTWKELGFPYDGSTQALVFDSTIKRDRSEGAEFMLKQYAKGYVKNHSVGMRYVKLILAINDKDAGANWEAWEKYFPEVANKEVAEDRGYFWAVKEAKVIEGSAVPRGSNPATPTLDNNKEFQPLEDTELNNEPPKDTRKINLNFFN